MPAISEKQKPLVANRWVPTAKLGSGGFGTVYVGKDLETGGTVALKTEFIENRSSSLSNEWLVYNNLVREDDPIRGIPKPMYFGECDGRHVMVMERFGPSVHDLFDKKRDRGGLDPKWVTDIALQLLATIEHVHGRGYVHCDIKPANILVARRDKSKAFLVDFGLALRYCSYGAMRHVPMRKGLGFTGSLMFASVHAHEGLELSRRDDLESLGYSLIYLFAGKLPWSSIHGPDERREEDEIYRMKKSVRTRELCRGAPREMIEYMRYVNNLKFEQRPDYRSLRGLFRKARNRYSRP